MTLYERVASVLIGTPLQGPAEWLRRARRAGHRRRHPELAELFLEDERIDALMRRTIGSDTNCIDIGCHLGTYLQKIVELAPRGSHHAFEPVPRKAAWLRRKFPSVSVLELALGDQEASTCEFFVPSAETALSGTTARGEAAAGEILKVRCARLDDALGPGARIGFIKIDVNGGELPVLRGARRLLANDRPFILLGCTKGGLADYGIEAGEVFEFVTAAKYQVFLPKDLLAGGAPLDLRGFEGSMDYPFRALNYAVVPTSRQNVHALSTSGDHGAATAARE